MWGRCTNSTRYSSICARYVVRRPDRWQLPTAYVRALRQTAKCIQASAACASGIASPYAHIHGCSPHFALTYLKKPTGDQPTMRISSSKHHWLPCLYGRLMPSHVLIRQLYRSEYVMYHLVDPGGHVFATLPNAYIHVTPEFLELDSCRSFR